MINFLCADSHDLVFCISNDIIGRSKEVAIDELVTACMTCYREIEK